MVCQKRRFTSFRGCLTPLLEEALSFASRRLRSASLSLSSLEDSRNRFDRFVGLTDDEVEAGAFEDCSSSSGVDTSRAEIRAVAPSDDSKTSWGTGALGVAVSCK